MDWQVGEVGSSLASDTASVDSSAYRTTSLARVQAHRAALAVRNEYVPPELVQRRRHGEVMSVWTKPSA
jgi:hypothetical protein